ncbi:branched-chain amino acid transport system substrate-binding protein [Rhizobium petrolearium]|uniref:ABC transporter substrate-binding protein n=2 Tax=Neorhizobium TaxID=1525371 RepID=A0ABV0MCU2_9HYPH|nr:ABC transporter substrate-binding protein [Neorhizobium petrolearium]MBP1848414.1 branched-chain amino acid transport system substrate-binding protein [Neorhizobium petrolearium]MCC2614473.1 ABC transporter substrate-binding protein [Neorhizobium petrolearium]WGI72236.1 ABC transporter substrate-binding protein [Neorhizobium petrolearium]
MRTTKLYAGVAAAAFLIAAGASSAADATIKIGVATALTGAYGDLGQQVKRAVDFAVEEVNAKGGIDGRKVETQYQDTQAKADIARQQAEKLVNDGFTILTGSIASGEALGIAPMLERWDAVMMGTVPKADALTGAECSPRFFRANIPDYADAATVGTWLKEQSEKKWAIMGSDTAWGRNSGASFTKTASGLTRDIVAEGYAGLGTNDFAPYIQKILDSGAEGVWVALAGRDAINFAQQAKQFGLIDKLKVAGVSFVTDNTVKTLGDVSKGIYGIINYSSTLDTPANKAFVDAWAKKYPGTLPANFEGETYLGMQVLFAGIDKADSTSPEDIAEALEGIETDTIIGKISVRQADHQFVRGNFFGRIEDQDGTLRPVVATSVAADVAMPAADDACKL